MPRAISLPGPVSAALLAQRGHLFGWVPVCLGLGIGGWFALDAEPGLAGYAGLAALAALALGLTRAAGDAAAPLWVGLALVCGGFGLAGARGHAVAAPILEFRYYGPIEGRIVAIDRSASDAMRLTLDRVRLDAVRPEKTPERIRVALHGGHGPTRPAPGQVVILTGHLSPPGGPVEPGGFDFARHAWFDRLGAVGYTRTPVLLLRQAEPGAALAVHRLRDRMSAGLRAAMPERTGGVAAAIVTGDRSGITVEVRDALRASNLAHLLAISGLHMGLLTGFIFAALRYGMALWPALALHWPVKKIAAGAALLAGAGYLVLSGGSVATERAFVMVAVMLVAVMLDRRALTLRAVAMAAVIVLVRRPEELTGPGFQMSFAATTALVVAFGHIRDLDLPRLPWWGRNVGAVFLSSLVAGLATAPFAAAHFNMIAHYGLIANLLAVPVMGAVVMPAAVVAGCLWLVGLQGVGLWVMDLGLNWIITVAETVAARPGAVGHVPTPMPAVLPVLTLGLLAAILWQGRARIGALAALPLAFGLWTATERPLLLVAESGKLVGVLTERGRALSHPRGEGFAARVWLENDGAPVSQETAAARGVFDGADRVLRADLGAGAALVQVRGTRARDGLDGCGGAILVVLDTEDRSDRPCLVLDEVRLRETGAVAGYGDGAGGLRLVSAREITGDRLWTRRGSPAPAPLILARNGAGEGQ